MRDINPILKKLSDKDINKIYPTERFNADYGFYSHLSGLKRRATANFLVKEYVKVHRDNFKKFGKFVKDYLKCQH
jgi:hypothetical protein